MNIVFDFGNTLIKAGIFNELKVVDVFIFNEFKENEITNIIINYNINYGIISSVINHSPIIEQFLEKYLTNLLILKNGISLPISIEYKTPETLGNDRIASAIGANSLFPNKNILVIDAGTCIKYDFVNVSNTYLGGGISPGIFMRFQALNKFTDKLPLLNSKFEITDLIGNDTLSSINSGVINGVKAEIENIINYYIKK